MKLVALTGAGMSAESGVPTFRDALSGLWSRFDAERLATPAAFARDPDLVWGWYRWRAAQVLHAAPHAGHVALAELPASGVDTTIVTQNVDDLHERAGSVDVQHLHGRLLRSRCSVCAARPEPEPLRAPYDADDEGRREPPPRCARCGGAVRPDVVWFGEALPEDAWNAAVEAIRAADRVVVVGTSGMVQPAASLPRLARQLGRHVLEINPTPSALTPDVDDYWPLPASSGLARLRDDLR